MKQKLQESKNRTQNVLNPSRVNKLKSKLLIMSLSIFCLSINDNGFFQDLNANITDVLDIKNKELYKKVLDVVQQKVCQNIELKAKDCGLGNKYWAKKAIDDENDRFSNSIKNLEVLIAMSYVVDDVQYNEIVRKFKKAITNSLNKFGKLMNEGNPESGQDSQDTKLNSEIDKCRNSVLGLINAWMVFETLVQHWWPPQGNVGVFIADSSTFDTAYRQFRHIWFGDSVFSKNRWPKRTCSPLNKELSTLLKNGVQDGEKLYNVIIRSQGIGERELFEHEFENWLEAFWVIKLGNDKNNKVVNSVLRKTYNTLRDPESVGMVYNDTEFKPVPVEEDQGPNDGSSDDDDYAIKTEVVLRDNKINNKNGDDSTIVIDSNVNNIEETTKKDKKENNVLRHSKAEALQNGRIKNVNPFAMFSPSVGQEINNQNGNGLNNQSDLRNKLLGNANNPSNYQDNPNSNNVNANIDSGNMSNNINIQQGAFYQNKQTSNNQVDNRPWVQNNGNKQIQNAFFGKINNSSQNSNNNLNNKFNMIPSYLNNQNVNYNIGNMNNNIKSYQNALNYQYNQNSVNMNAKQNVVNVDNNTANRALMMPNNLYNNVGQFISQNKNTQQGLDLFNMDYNVGTAGLTNIGSTCYKNATLQCLLHIRPLTNWLLNTRRDGITNRLEKNGYLTSANGAIVGSEFVQEGWKEPDLNAPEDAPSPSPNQSLLPFYLELVNKTIKPYIVSKHNSGSNDYSPDAFMQQLEKMNGLFKLGTAGDAKDFIIYILEQIHKELKSPVPEWKSLNLPVNQYNMINTWQTFINEFTKEVSIITDTFYGFLQTTNVCKNCKEFYGRRRLSHPVCYNYQVFNSVIFPLEKVKNSFSRDQYNQTDGSVNLYQCFLQYQMPEYFQGENRNYCNVCRQLYDSVYTTRLYSLPRVLILIMNRGKNNIYNIKLNFPCELELYPDRPGTTGYVMTPNPNCRDGVWRYDLIGVVSHIGQSGPNAHFVASCRNSRYHQWIRYNDSIVKPIDDFQKDVHDFGTPYVLFYLLRE